MSEWKGVFQALKKAAALAGRLSHLFIETSLRREGPKHRLAILLLSLLDGWRLQPAKS